MEDKIYPVVYNKNYNVVMANDILKGKSDLTLQQARLIRLIIMQVAKEDKDLKTYTCRIQDLAKFLGISSSNLYAEVYSTCEELLKCIVHIKTGNSKKAWEMILWFSTAKYDGNGTMTLRLSQEISNHVLELDKWFTKYQLEEVLSFSSYYSIRLYELLKCEIGIANDRKSSFEFTLLELREFFSCENRYPANKDFNQYVINKAVLEINLKSDIYIIVDFVKTGRAITSVKFNISSINPMRYKEEIKKRVRGVKNK